MAMVERILTGPDGANPLGFLCALGVLRTLSNAWPNSEVRMKWTQIGAAWRPVLRASHADLDGKDEAGQNKAIVNAILGELSRTTSHPMMKWDGSHNIPATDYRAYAFDAIKSLFDQNQSDHRPAEWAAALACDQITREKRYVEDTAFRTMSGQGHQLFLKQMRLLQQSIGEEHIDEALFEWKYRDTKLNLRFEPLEDRRYALRWKSPREDTIKTVWGANRLAAEGLPLYPVFPLRGRLRTTGFRGSGENDTFWTWPIWSKFLSVSVVRSILSLPELQADKPPHAELQLLGIVEVYRTQRITVGRFRAFTPAQAV